MKKVLKVIGVLLLLGIAAVGIIWWYSRTSNPWDAKCVGDISAPVGYTRATGSYAEFMRSLPLKKHLWRIAGQRGGYLAKTLVVPKM